MDTRFEYCDARRLLALLDFGSRTESSSPSDDPPLPRAVHGATATRVTDGSPPHITGYAINGVLGEGGMGVVWRAVQLSTRRAVALKLLPLSQNRRARLRFDREVELTARLQHPHIAQVYDSGVHDGQYFYAMELIEGEPLHQFVSARSLRTRQILDLMLRVALAVQHAHNRGVIHRDLKPSNILVTADGQPHVLDFGLAKFVTTADARASDVSLDSDVMGTPEFMSPEQAAGRTAEIDTRTDVYSLGATLFLLLTGECPHAAGGSKLEFLRRIAEQEPRRPRSMSKEIDAELEALLLKSLNSHPDGRYRSAGEFAQDISNYLAGDPLFARRATAWYFLRKRLRKRWLPVSLAAAGLAAFIGLAIFSYLRIAEQRQTAEQRRVEAQAQQKNAEEQAAIAKAVSGFLADMISAADPDRMLGENVTVLKAVQQAVTKLDAGALEDQPLVEAAVRETIGSTLRTLSRYPDAETHLRAALEIRRRILPPGHRDVAASLRSLSSLCFDQGNFVEAESLDREAVDLLRRATPVDHPEIARSLSSIARNCFRQGKLPEAERFFNDALALQRSSLPGNDIDTAETLGGLAKLMQLTGRPLLGIPVYRESLVMREAVLPEGHPKLAEGKSGLAMALYAIGSFDEAERLQREALATYRKAISTEHREIATAAYNLARILRDQKKLDEAEVLHLEALATYRNVLPAVHPEIARSLSSIGDVLRSRGKHNAAEPLFRESVAMRRRLFPDTNHPEVAHGLFGLASTLREQGKFEEAEGHYREALAISRNVSTAYTFEAYRTFTGLIATLEAQGKDNQVKRARRELVDYLRKTRPPDHLQRVQWVSTLGETLHADKEYADAAICFREVLASYRRVAENHPDHLNSLISLAWCLATCADDALRDPSQAVALAERAVKLAPQAPGCWNTLGVARYRARDFKGALAAFERSLQLGNGGQGGGFFFLAMTHAHTGDPHAARAWYEKGIQSMQRPVLEDAKFLELRRFRAEAEDTVSIKGSAVELFKKGAP